MSLRKRLQTAAGGGDPQRTAWWGSAAVVGCRSLVSSGRLLPLVGRPPHRADIARPLTFAGVRPRPNHPPDLPFLFARVRRCPVRDRSHGRGRQFESAIAHRHNRRSKAPSASWRPVEWLRPSRGYRAATRQFVGDSVRLGRGQRSPFGCASRPSIGDRTSPTTLGGIATELLVAAIAATHEYLCGCASMMTFSTASTGSRYGGEDGGQVPGVDGTAVLAFHAGEDVVDRRLCGDLEGAGPR